MLNSISFFNTYFFYKKTLPLYIYYTTNYKYLSSIFKNILPEFWVLSHAYFFWHIFLPPNQVVRSCTSPQRSSPLKGAAKGAAPLTFNSRGGLPRTFVRKELELWYCYHKKGAAKLPYSLFYFFNNTTFLNLIFA